MNTVGGTAVEYRRVADRRYVAPLFALWLALLGPYVVVRIVWTDWRGPLGALAVAFDVSVVLVAAATATTARRLYLPVERPVELSRYGVDCLIPTHTEDVAVVEPTVVAARAIRSVRRVLVLGNFERSDLRELCRRLGVTYVVRGTNVHAKAGNLNNGLAHTDAEFIVVLDADHIARPDLLERVLGYVDDPRVAYVQGPQTYYNTESFLFRRQHGHPAGWNEQQPYYQCLQLGRNAGRCALFMGSTAVLRRRALDDIGGFAEGTIAEDVHTSLRLLARGWHAVAIAEPLAFGIEAGNFTEYHNQRHRWAVGAFTLLRAPESPVRVRRLRPGTRVVLVAALAGNLAGVARLGLLAVPVLTLLTLRSPVTVPYAVFGPVQVGWLVVTAVLLHVLHRRAGNVRYAGEYSYGSMLALVTAVGGLVVRSRTFVTSRKQVGRSDRHWAKWVLWVLAGLTAAALVRGGYLVVRNGPSTLVLWAALMAVVQETWLVAFLSRLARFERGTAVPGYTALSGAHRRRHVLDRFAAGEIGPAQAVLRRPLAGEESGA